jgi:uncharacterized membrane protein (DUF4010 family)
MAVRVVIATSVVNRTLVPPLLVPMGAMCLAALGAAYYFYRSTGQHATEEVDFKNPFELSSALKFGLLYSIVQFGSKAAAEYLGDTGLYLTGLIAGTTDVDVVVLSVANLDPQRLAPGVAVTVIFLAVASNTLVKAGMAIALGGFGFGRRVAMAYTLTLLAGAAALLLVRSGS